MGRVLHHVEASIVSPAEPDARATSKNASQGGSLLRHYFFRAITFYRGILIADQLQPNGMPFAK